MASNMHHGLVPRWFENMRHDMGDDTAADYEGLIGEASHAAGNLVHRMYYLAGVLEEDPEAAEAADAVEQLKLSLAGLHRLVNRTMGLIRPINAQPLPVPAPDILASIAMRFDQTAGAAGGTHHEIRDTHLDCFEVAIDLIQFDRALGLVAEAVGVAGRSDDDHEPPSTLVGIDVDLEPLAVGSDPSNNDRTGLVIQLQTERIRTVRGLPSDEVSSQVSLALAARVLALFEWRMELEEQGRSSRLSIFVPLSRVSTSQPTRRGDAPL